MDTLFVTSADEVEYQKRLAVLLVEWRRLGDDSAVHDLIFISLDGN